MRLSGLAITALSAIAAFVLLLLYGPLAVAIFFSFFRLERNAVQWDSFSFDAYRSLFQNRAILDALTNTVIVGVSAVLLALIFGTLIALHYHNSRSRLRHVLQFVVFLPFLMPPIITGLSLLIFFRETDIPRSLATVVVGHTVFVLAIVYRIVLTRLKALKPSLIDASLDLGASRWQTFRLVVMPNLTSAFISAAILAFALSFDETLITLLVTGTKNTLPMWLWSSMRLGFKPDINALVALILFFSAALAYITMRLFRPKRAT
jgi:ABC-type spermidine/putrescine transport system permease subunit II